MTTRVLLALVVLVVGCTPAAPPVVVTRYVYVQAPTPQPEATYAPAREPPPAGPPRVAASSPPGVWTEPHAAQGAPVAPGQPYAESTDPRWSTRRIAAPQYAEPPLPVVDAPFAPPPTVYVREGYPYAYAPYYGPTYYGPAYYGGAYYSRPFVGVGVGVGIGGGFHGGFRGGYGGGFHGGGFGGGRGGFGHGGRR